MTSGSGSAHSSGLASDGASAAAPAAATAAERECLGQWWRHFAATGELPAALEPVQTRLIRSVHRATLPGGDVFVKTMTFPRLKDRFRYLVRALPAAHEAAMLARVRAAGIPCPEVVDVREARRLGLPWRSWLVTRALRLPAAEATPPRLAEQAALAVRLLAAGIVHRDLHADNFVRLASGDVAVLDLQSASAESSPRTDRAARLAAAARLVRDVPVEQAAELVQGGLVHDEIELDEALVRAAAERQAYARRRVLRCLRESTGFTRRVRWSGVLHSHRGERPDGRWLPGRHDFRDVWIGQRANQLFGSRSPVFWAFFRKWWWLGGGTALYVPTTCSEERIEQELAIARSGAARLDGRH